MDHDQISLIRFIGTWYALVQVYVSSGIQQGKSLKIINIKEDGMPFVDIKPQSNRIVGGDKFIVDQHDNTAVFYSIQPPFNTI